MKTVYKTSVLPASRDIVFSKLQELETLQYIAAPYATFTTIGPNDSIWAVGSTTSYRFSVLLHAGGYQKSEKRQGLSQQGDGCFHFGIQGPGREWTRDPSGFGQGLQKTGFKQKYLPFYRLICSTRLGRLCTSDHAMNAVDEMNAMNDDFRAVLLRYGIIPKEWNDLEKDCNGYIVPKE